MKRLLFLFVVCLLILVGCAPAQGPTATPAPARAQQPTRAPSAPPSPTSASKAPSGDLMPPYPGATQGTVNQEDQKQFGPLKSPELRAYGTQDKPSAVIAFYKDEMKKRGWNVALDMSSEKGGLIQWKKDALEAAMLVTEKEGKTVILLGWGERGPAETPTPKVYSLREALALAQPKAAAWQADAYIAEFEAGGAFVKNSLLSPQGRGPFWHIRFYSPSAKQSRYVNVDGRSGTDAVDYAGEAYAGGEATSLEGILDSTAACEKAAALGGQEVIAKYADAQIFASAYADEKGIHLFVQYYSETAKERDGIPLGYVLGMELDGKTGELVQYQQKDGKPVQ